jgi:hypothetical protein
VKGGRRGLVVVAVMNNGNYAASGPLAIDLQASASGAIDVRSIDLGTVNAMRHCLPVIEEGPIAGKFP